MTPKVAYSPAPEVTTRLSTSPKPRVLLVEDNQDTQDLLLSLLDEHYEVVAASTYTRGLELAESTPCDLFIIDIHLAGDGRNGVDLLQAIRKLKPYATTPALACTAYGPKYGAFDWYRREGFNAYLRKPFDLDELVRELRRLVASQTSH